MHNTNNRLEDALESLKEEAREEGRGAGYQEGYLAALNDIELRIIHMQSDEMWYGLTEGLRKMVTSR